VTRLWRGRSAATRTLRTGCFNKRFIAWAVRANMTSTENWWQAKIDWETPAGVLVKKLLALLPGDRHFQITLYGSAPLQLTIDRSLLSGDVDLFSDQEDIASIIREHKLDKEHGGAFYL
jgi:hypothetical protein